MQQTPGRNASIALARSPLRSLPPLSALLLLSAIAPWAAEARDLTGRLGLGFNSEFSAGTGATGTPAVSIKYALAKDLAAELIAGVSTGAPVESVAAMKVFKNLFFETNLNFYFTAGAGMVTAGENAGVEFLGAFGSEFFLPGLESVGFSFEAGGTLDNASGTFAFRTLGASFLQAGMHFYF